MKTVFTKASKLVKDSAAVSFDLSGSERSSGESTNCDPRCRLLELCYASRIERIYKGLNAKLADHAKRGPLWVVNQAILQLRPKPIRWFRFSVNGSVPEKYSLGSDWPKFTTALRILISKAQVLGAKVHFPVESINKARAYRTALQGLNIVVRRSVQTGLSAAINAKDHCSIVISDGPLHSGCVTKEEKRTNTAASYAAAKRIRAAGRSAVVCPAVAGSSKCGKCTACADPAVDIVVYPFHG